MKRFETPAIRISEFTRESILTESTPQQPTTAVDKALAAANDIPDSVGAFIVDID